MKVLHVSEIAIAGTGAHINELIPLQQEVFGRDNVKLLTPAEHLSQVSDIDPKSVFTFHRPNRLAGLPFLAVALVKVIFTFHPDLVHAHSTFAGVIARLICFPLRVPVVYCPHGWATDRDQPGWARQITVLVERFLAKITKHVFAVSEYERKQGIAIGIPPNKISTVYNGIRSEPPTFTPVEWDDNRLKILFVGRLARQKGIDILLEAIKDLQEKICVRVIGDIEDKNTESIFKGYPHIKSIGWVSPPVVTAHIAVCDAVVMPSRWEGFGLVAIEAMRLSKPVIASDVGGLPEIVLHGKTGYLVKPKDSVALRQVLLSLDKNELSKMGQEGRKRFLSCFTSEKMAEGIMTIYRKIEN